MYPLGSRISHSVIPRLIIAMLAITIALGLFGIAAPARAASVTVPITVRNTTGSDAPVYLYLLGEQLTSGSPLGYVDAGGTFHPWPAASSTAPQAAPDVSIPGPADGATTTIQLPEGISGRLYYSVGQKLDFKLVRNDLGRTALVQPAPWVSGDANHGKLFDWTEFTFSNGLWINSTQVDQFALPAAVSVTGSSGTHTVGGLVGDGRQGVIDAMLADPTLARTVVKGADGQVLRVLSPGHATREGLLSSGYLDEAIDKAWALHASTPLIVRPFTDQPSVTFTGRTLGNKMVFTSTSGATVASFDKPSSVDVFECAGALVAPNDLVVGPIARTLCAALNRGTLGSGSQEPVTNTATFYRSTPANAYAKAVHAALADGRAYAFPFDDVGQQESLVHDSSPTSVTLTLPSLGGATAAKVTPTPIPTATPTPSATPTATEIPTPTVTATGSGSSLVATVVLRPDSAGWATLTFGAGTRPGLVTITVDGGSTSTVAIDGAVTVRTDLSGPAGSRQVTISSTAALGTVTVTPG